MLKKLNTTIMKLNVIERIELLKLVIPPKEGDYLTFKILFDLRVALSFKEKEFKQFGIIEKEGQISWAESKDVEVKIGEKGKEIIAESLRKVDAAKKLNPVTFTLCDKFEVFTETNK